MKGAQKLLCNCKDFQYIFVSTKSRDKLNMKLFLTNSKNNTFQLKKYFKKSDTKIPDALQK